MAFCEPATIALLLLGQEGQVHSTFRVPLTPQERDGEAAHWLFDVPEGQYQLAADVTNCDHSQKRVELVETPVDVDHRAALVYLRPNQAHEDFELSFVEHSSWMPGVGTLELQEATARSVTLRNMSMGALQQCATRPYLKVEYEIQGRWRFHAINSSLDWPDKMAVLEPNQTLRFSPGFSIIRKPDGNESQVRPTRKRILFFYQPRGINARIVGRHADGWVMQGPGCDILYLVAPADASDPMVLTSEMVDSPYRY